MGVLEGKTAVVTGAGQGIGKAIALKLGAEGAKVVVCDLNEDTAASTVGELTAAGTEAIAVMADVSNADSVAGLCKTAKNTFGQIDILVNNAGITKDQLLMRMKEADWDAVMNVNLKSVFLVTKTIIREMIKAKSGKIITISSVIGLMGNAGQCNYAASKAGIIGFTKSIAKEVGSYGINVNAIAPGFIESDMTKDLPEDVREGILSQTPMRKMGTPEDVANMVSFLASDASSYVTGQVVAVDGGMTD